MNQIQDIFDICTGGLYRIIGKIKDSIPTFVKSEKDSDKLVHVINAYAELATQCKECALLSEMIAYMCKNLHNVNGGIKYIEDYKNRYEKSTRIILLKIGSLKDALRKVDNFDIQNNLDKFMIDVDKTSKINEMLVSEEIMDKIQSNELDLLDEIDNTHSKKVKGKKQSKSHKTIDDDEDQEPDESEESLDNISEGSAIDLEEISEKDVDFFNENIAGGMNEQSDATVIAGGDTFIIGEKYNFFVRDLFIKIKHAEDIEEQIKILGFKNEKEITDTFSDKEKLEATFYQIMKSSGVSDLFCESIDRFGDRVKSYLASMKQNVNVVKKKYTELLSSIDEIKKDPLNWNQILKSYHPLLIMTLCVNAVEQKGVVNQAIKRGEIKELITETKKNLEKQSEIKLPEPFDSAMPTVNISARERENPMETALLTYKSWIPIMKKIEEYLGESIQFIDNLWLPNDLSVPALKYRLYYLKTISNKLDTKYTNAVESLCKKYKVGEYKTFNDLLNDFVESD